MPHAVQHSRRACGLAHLLRADVRVGPIQGVQQLDGAHARQALGTIVGFGECRQVPAQQSSTAGISTQRAKMLSIVRKDTE